MAATDLAGPKSGISGGRLSAPVRQPVVGKAKPPIAADGSASGDGACTEAGGGLAAKLPGSLERVTNVWERSDDAAHLMHRDSAVGGEGCPSVHDSGARQLAQARAKLVQRFGFIHVEQPPVADERTAETGRRWQLAKRANAVGDSFDVPFFGGYLARNHK